MNSFIADFNLVSLGQNIIDRALQSPTHGLEDNIQLHSAAQVECDFFLTYYKELLKIKFFGKVRIVEKIP